MSWLTFAIREGKNREVRNVLGHLGLEVARLIRVSFGPFQLGELAEGAVEEVSTRTLREQLGERVVAASSADFSSPVAAPPSVSPKLDKKEEARGDVRQKADARQIELPFLARARTGTAGKEAAAKIPRRAPRQGRTAREARSTCARRSAQRPQGPHRPRRALRPAAACGTARKSRHPSGTIAAAAPRTVAPAPGRIGRAPR